MNHSNLFGKNRHMTLCNFHRNPLSRLLDNLPSNCLHNSYTHFHNCLRICFCKSNYCKIPYNQQCKSAHNVRGRSNPEMI